MQWIRTSTDRDWDAQHRINEELRLERIARQSSIICPIETTPAGEPFPKLTMARFRNSLIQQQTDKLKELLEGDDLLY